MRAATVRLRQHSTHHWAALTKKDFSKLKQQPSLPLRCLRLSDEFGRDTFVIDPSEIDAKLREVWQPIRRGKIDDAPRIVASYMQKYSRFIPDCASVPLQPLRADSLLNAVAASPNSSAGMDGISPADLKLMSLGAATALAIILNSIEAGAPWPSVLLLARTAFLDKAKVPSFASDPLQLRILTITQATYRLWARARLADLAPWIKEWDDSHIFGGLPGRGAEDAWYSTALLQESVALRGESFTAGSVDLMK